MNGDQRRPSPALFKVVNPIVRPLLRSPLHGLLSGQLMLLAYAGRVSGRERTIPIGYFAWEDGAVISSSSTRWWVNLQDGRSVRLLVRGQWRSAVPVVAPTLEDRVGLLGEFVTRLGSRAARRLYLGLPGDRSPAQQELIRAAERTAIVRFRFS
jgi:hypothetical protein